MKGLNNQSMQSLKFPNGISKISDEKQVYENSVSFLEELEQWEGTMVNESLNFYNSKISNLNDHDTLKFRDKKKNRQRKRKQKNKQVKNRRRVKETTSKKKMKTMKNKRMLDFLKFDENDLNSSDVSKMRISMLINSQQQSKISEVISDTDSEMEDSNYDTSRKHRSKNIVIRNSIGKIDQKINVSNYNCSCRVF